MKIQIGKTALELVKGDITSERVDIIVNAANNMLWMGSGVAGAIKARGGETIEKEAISKGPIEVGEVVVTNAGELDAKYIVHAAVMGQDLKTDSEKIKQVTRRSLEEANYLKAKSIAFPAFGTGVGHFPARDCAKLMLGEIIDYLLTCESNLEIVKLVLYEVGIYNIFKDELNARFRRGGHTPR